MRSVFRFPIFGDLVVTLSDLFTGLMSEKCETDAKLKFPMEANQFI